jgi:hypothetical protein
MSINDFMNKIKDKIGIDKTAILYLFIIVGVGISSFFLGRITTENNLNSNDIKSDISIIEKVDLKEKENKEFDTIPEVREVKEKLFVASKNGKMYYTIGCSGAKRIKEENQIWFATEIDAQKSGYSLSLTCK